MFKSDDEPPECENCGGILEIRDDASHYICNRCNAIVAPENLNS